VTEALGNIGERLDLRIGRGRSFRLDIEMIDGDGRPIDLTGATVAAAVRKRPDDAGVLARWMASYGPARGWVSLALEPEQSVLLPAPQTFEKPVKVVWDCFAVWTDGYVEPLYYGYIEVYPGITPHE
jgi:hypothetical protein